MVAPLIALYRKVSDVGNIQVIIFRIAIILILPSHVLSWFTKLTSEKTNRCWDDYELEEFNSRKH